MPRRTHSKISRLPTELRDAVNDLLVNRGCTIEEVAAFLRERGHEIGKSSVGRYSQSFAENLKKLREVREQTSALVQELSGRPATEMHEAANALAIQKIFERLLDAKDEIDAADVTGLIRAVGTLERAAVWNENAKLRFKREAEEAAKKAAEEAAGKLTEIGKREGINPETLKRIREEVYGIVT